MKPSRLARENLVESAAFNGRYVSPNQYENELNVDAHYHTTSLIDDIIAVDDQDAYQAGIRLARTEGIMVGPTAGAVLHAAHKFGVNHSGHAVVISPDSATKYLSAYAKYLEDS